MSQTTTVQIQVGSQPLTEGSINDHFILSLPIPLTCPLCQEKDIEVGTWGSYSTTTGEVRRFRCKNCLGTFNPAKIPFWKKNVQEIIWKLTQLVIKDRFSVNALVKMWGVPETTLRTLVTAIKEFLATNLERAKQLQERLGVPSTTETSSLRIIFYDEGFLKLLGANGFIIFTLDSDGTPINVAIEPKRDAQTIHGYFVQAITQLGGIDVIVGDGAVAILAAAKALRQPLILVQHIHQGKGKRSRITTLEPISNRKALWDITIELHTGTLLSNVESKVMTRKKKVYPAKWSTPVTRIKHKIRGNKIRKSFSKRSSILTPTEGVGPTKEVRKRKTSFLKGHAIALRTASKPYELEINYIPGESNFNSPECPSLAEVYPILARVQQALPDQFISSNRAEVFNALHDRYNVYWGQKTLIHANRDLQAWTAVTFFPEGSRALFRRHSWHIPYRLLFQLWPLMISKVKIS
jgi:transposase-like protein